MKHPSTFRCLQVRRKIFSQGYNGNIRSYRIWPSGLAALLAMYWWRFIKFITCNSYASTVRPSLYVLFSFNELNLLSRRTQFAQLWQRRWDNSKLHWGRGRNVDRPKLWQLVTQCTRGDRRRDRLRRRSHRVCTALHGNCSPYGRFPLAACSALGKVLLSNPRRHVVWVWELTFRQWQCSFIVRWLHFVNIFFSRIDLTYWLLKRRCFRRYVAL